MGVNACTAAIYLRLVLVTDRCRRLVIDERRRVMRIRSIIVLLLGAGCTGGTEPLRGDIYVLQSIAGVAVPAPYTKTPSANGRIIADTLAFDIETFGTRRTVYEGANGPADVHSEEIRFSYLRTGDSVSINFVCPPNADCMPGPHLVGTFTATGLTIDTSALTRVPLVFARIMPLD
jgi:hypothetical protein